jgi:predicted transcriptional regulator
MRAVKPVGMTVNHWLFLIIIEVNMELLLITIASLLLIMVLFAQRLVRKEYERRVFIIRYLTENPGSYGLDIVKASDGLLKRGTVYIDLTVLKENGIVESKKDFSVFPGRNRYWLA